MKVIMAKLSKLDKLDDIAKKLEVIDQKVTNVDTRQLKTETKVTQIENDVNDLKQTVTASSSNEVRMMKAIRQAEIQQIKSEENGRKYNVIINNYPQTKLFEDRKDTLEIVRLVLSDVLKIRGSKNMVIKNAYRLPASKGVKPIIFKINTLCDKQLIWDTLNT